MGVLGAEVRRLREARGADLEQVAAATKVGVHHLKALEIGDFGALPGDVFVRGFVRAIADFLGARPEALLALYRRERESLEPAGGPTSDRTVQEMSRILARAPGRRARGRGFALRIGLGPDLGKVVLGTVGLALGAGALAFFLIGRRDEAGPTQASPPLRASRKASGPVQSAPPALPPAAAVIDPSPTVAAPPPEPEPEPAAKVESKKVEEKQLAEKPSTAAAASEELEVSEHGVGSGVEGSRLVGQASRFEEGAPVWFFTRIDGGRSGQTIRHVWLHDDREVHSVKLEVGGTNWRTWSRKTLRPGSAGRWSVEARDAYGRVLASEEFECVAKP